MTHLHRRQWLLAAAAASALGPVRALAQEGRELRIVVPTGAGGPLDAIARTIADQLQTLLKQPAIVDNRGGAAGQIAASAVAKAVGDPNMMLLGSMGIMAVSPHLYPKLPYDVKRDFTPVALCARAPIALVVNPSVVPVRNLAEFVAWAKAQNAPVPIGTFGSGSTSHIAGEMFASAASLRFTQVPYRDPGRVTGDLVKGDLPVTFDPPSSYVGFAKEGKVRMLAITSKARSAGFPDLPTFDESGFPGFDFSNWFGLFMPAKVSTAAAERVHAAVKTIVDSKAFKDQALLLGFDATNTAAENFPAMFDAELQRWGAFVRKNNIKLET